MHQFDAIIIGGGAAGLMCAIEAGKRGRRVAVLEHADRLGKKILISGGGRCNFTNLHCRPENFLSANRHFAKSALARYTPADFIALVEKHRIPYHEKTLGQLFCDRSAQDILTMLEDECRAGGVSVRLRTKIREVRRDTAFVVRSDHEEFRAPALVIASGGLSIPKMGATGFGYDVARQFGLKIRQPRPALVPLTLDEADRARYCDLAGVAAEVVASVDSQQFREKMLITHRGLSGPAILQISSYWDRSNPITLDLAPGRAVTDSLLGPKGPRDLAAARNAVRSVLPNRLADRWLELHPPEGWSNRAIAEFERQLHHWRVVPNGTEGFDKAEVTAGGVDTDELSAKTMESRKVPGLFFIGEVVDVTGHLGGFNFQWAWASGYCAGQAI
ncbi:MAG TPA: NAD(P)/FAD-dependent oxidoreductase [Clostridia bacterium]|nr:NAD(P)/FAD-dependent oxidoreductase [Clostridia bacterium]